MSPTWKIVATAPAVQAAHVVESITDEFDTTEFYYPVHVWTTQENQYIDLDGGVTTRVVGMYLADGGHLSEVIPGVEYRDESLVWWRIVDGPAPEESREMPRVERWWRKFCEHKGIEYVTAEAGR
ncbi:hypothetical protein ACPXB3_00460 [Gordonia sp. DT219]|uniref:hypothetical protein n=1 Tax=Gordonia sp. DT219 TaxID=3416658 RepID=UPI003CE7881C